VFQNLGFSLNKACTFISEQPCIGLWLPDLCDVKWPLVGADPAGMSNE
jgi:hypothetical protein